jgi:hypothetical protein
LKQLDTIENFDGDPALKYSCSETLKYYKKLAETDIPQIRDFFIEEEKFLKIQKEFKNKPLKKYSQPEISAYNKVVKKNNHAVTNFIQLNNSINSSRKQTLYNWHATLKIFMDAHTLIK